jgi:hypothetical protein
MSAVSEEERDRLRERYSADESRIVPLLADYERLLRFEVAVHRSINMDEVSDALSTLDRERAGKGGGDGG